MDREVSLHVRLLDLSARKRLALVLIVFAVSAACYHLVFPTVYFSCLLLLPLICAAWLFGWRGGLLCLAVLAILPVVRYGLVPGSALWRSVALPVFITGMLFGLVVCLAVGALRRMTALLLDERQSRERLQQGYQQEQALNVWKDQVFQDLNHELRIPLTQTGGYLELLETYRDDLDAATQAQFISLARSGCDELLNLIKTAMETLSASGTRHSLNMSLFSLRQEVQTVLAHYEPRLLQEHAIELDIPESMYVYADAGFVHQIVRNLLTNACKYTPAQTPVVVSAAPVSTTDCVREQAGRVCVRVQDYGPGIPPEQHTHLFQRFVRLPNATTSEQPGSGLGLAICRQLVEAMGGTIQVESTGKDGEGCCFSFTLESGAVAGAADQAKRSGGSHEQTKIISQEQQIHQYAAAPVGWSS